MNILKPTAFHTPVPNIQLVVNNQSVKTESLASFRIAPYTAKTQKQVDHISLPIILLVALLHVFAGMLLMQNQQGIQTYCTSLPMMVTIMQEKAIEPDPVVMPAETKPVVHTKPKVVANTQEKTKILATEEKPVVNEATSPAPAPQAAEITETPAAAKVAAAETAVKPEPKAETVYVAPSVGANYLHNPAPEYPQMARRRGEQGRVLIKVLVTSQGEASNVTLEKSSGSNYLDEAAIKAVKNWKFVPARSNNEAVSGYVTVPINFSLQS